MGASVGAPVTTLGTVDVANVVAVVHVLGAGVDTCITGMGMELMAGNPLIAGIVGALLTI